MTNQEIEEWLDSHWVKDYHFRDDGKVDVYSSVQLPNNLPTSDHGLYIPVEFGTVQGDFRCGQALLTSKLWLPEHIHGAFDCSLSPTLSLSGIHKAIKTIDTYVHCCHKSTHLLGALLISGVKGFDSGNSPVDNIINKYLPTQNVIMCQDELIDAGFIEQAKL